MESVFVSFVVIVVATLGYALRTVSRPPAPVEIPAVVGPTASDRAARPEAGRETETDGRNGLLDIA